MLCIPTTLERWDRYAEICIPYILYEICFEELSL